MLLRTPPWADGRRAPEPPTLMLAPLVLTEHLIWSDDEREGALHAYNTSSPPMDEEDVERYLDSLGVKAQARAGLRTGVPLQADDLDGSVPQGAIWFEALLRMPRALTLSLWNGMLASRWSWASTDAVLWLLAQHGDAATPGLVALAARRPVQGLRGGRWLQSPALARIALKSLRTMKVARSAAADWLLMHPDTSAQVLLRQLFGEQDPERKDARSALHDTALEALRPALVRAAEALGPEVAAALGEQLNADPLLRLPARMPRLPTFFDPAALHRPRLKQGGASLPDEAMRHLGTMLAISKPDQPYAGLDAVRAACTSASLAEFVWSLFEAWWAAEAPGKDAWCFTSLAFFGDDSTAHRLGTRTLRMAREGAKNRAQAAVDMLADFGSDAALMHLNSLVERCKVPAVRNRAAARIEAVAQARGLSRTELADRLVPTLGLDESRVLDFGPRQFEIGFDESLTPFVRDAQRARLKDLPKPRQSDDAPKATAASLRWKQLKTEMKLLARVQIARLEQAMVEQRRWSVDDFRSFFVTHPLIRELAARLLWAAWDAQGQVVGACRMAEDGTLADAQDRAWQPLEGMQLGIAHPLTLPPTLVDAFRLQFADYEVLQPFPQLAREVYRLTPAEATQCSLDRFDGQDLATGAVIGLLDRGWLRGRPQDGGAILWIDRPLGAGLVARLQLAPGMFVGQLSGVPRQKLGRLAAVDTLDKSEAFHPDQPTRFGRADPIAISETLRDLHRLTPSSLGPP